MNSISSRFFSMELLKDWLNELFPHWFHSFHWDPLYKYISRRFVRRSFQREKWISFDEQCGITLISIAVTSTKGIFQRSARFRPSSLEIILKKEIEEREEEWRSNLSSFRSILFPTKTIGTLFQIQFSSINLSFINQLLCICTCWKNLLSNLRNHFKTKTNNSNKRRRRIEETFVNHQSHR